MCMGGSAPAPPPPTPVIPPPPPPPPASPTARTVATARPTSSQPLASTSKPKQRNPLRTDSYDSGAPDAVATGLNIPV